MKTKLDEKGQGLTEYVTLLVLVSLSAVAITKSFGGNVKKAIGKANYRLEHKVAFGKDTQVKSDDDE